MLYVLLLLIHIDDADLASRLLMKSKEKKVNSLIKIFLMICNMGKKK